MTVADQREPLGFITHFSGIVSTYACMFCLRAYGIPYWGRLMGRVSPSGFSC
jgi:hypothetical protein